MLLSRHQKAGQNYDIKVVNIIRKCGIVQIFGNYRKESKFDSVGT
jgi:hypothetical protein